MKLMKIAAAAAIGLGALGFAGSAVAQPPADHHDRDAMHHDTGMHHGDMHHDTDMHHGDMHHGMAMHHGDMRHGWHGRHDRWHHRWGHRSHCRMVWRHHHRVRVCGLR